MSPKSKRNNLPSIKEKNLFWASLSIALVGGVFGSLFSNSFYELLKQFFGSFWTAIISGLFFLGILVFATKKIKKII